MEIYERPSEFLTIFKSLFFWGSIFSSVMLSLKKVVVKGRSVQKRDNDITRSSIQQVCKQEEEESAQSTTFAYIHWFISAISIVLCIQEGKGFKIPIFCFRTRWMTPLRFTLYSTKTKTRRLNLFAKYHFKNSLAQIISTKLQLIQFRLLIYPINQFFCGGGVQKGCRSLLFFYKLWTTSSFLLRQNNPCKKGQKLTFLILM